MVLPNNQQVLARSSVVAGAEVAHPPVSDIETIDNGEAEGSRSLDDATTHADVR
jgi:hypothetical protein